MKMLTKFESKSSRAKGVAFHPKRPWCLVSLHSSTIQLWDYRMGTLIDRFEEHVGPVRCVNFHATQPLFVSGGDDYSIKVWSLNTRKCIFTLNGHLDYVRGVSFHHELPWILSCSDDQTIRIWNWQNRQEIACLTGHNHYVMSAQFHPTEDLIVSASLDQTVRVWDISGLRKKHSAPTSSLRSFEDQIQRQQLPQQDIFGNVNAIVKYVLEGHDKGVNYAAFHPTLPLIVSAGDDRLVKLWRMSDTKAWEVDTCRGHTGNVLSAIFHPHQDMILSVSDDKTIRVWDLNKRVPIKQFRRENDRFWLIASHPNINLFAACHDSGVMVFKLERERPAHALYQNKLFYVNAEKQVQAFDYEKQECSLPMISLKKIGKSWSFMRQLSHNPTDNSILVVHGEGDSSNYALITLPKHATGAIEPTDIRQGEANFATFISRNRFVTFIKSSKTLHVKDLSNNVTKTIQLDSSVTDVLPSRPGCILLVKAHSVINYDVQQRKEISDLSVNNVKYVTWSHDGHYLALLSKHTITIANKDLELITSMHETIRIKSAAWDDSGVLLFSTLNHIKYTLLNGDNGIIKTLENTVYITKVTGNKVYCLNRAGQVDVITIDPTEYRFKRALVNGNFGEVLRLIKNSTLVGENIVAYLQKKGYSEVALHFVTDPETRFHLAIESGNLETALEECKKLDSKEVWQSLADESVLIGRFDITELCLQRLHSFQKLSFFYLISGQTDKLKKMSLIAANRGDASAVIQNSIYTNDPKAQLEVYQSAGMLALAHVLRKSQGLQDEGEEEQKAPAEAVLPEIGESLAVPQPVSTTSVLPLKDVGMSLFEASLTGATDLTIDEPQETAPEAIAYELEREEEEEEEEGGWDFEELDEEDVTIDENELGPGQTGSTVGALIRRGDFEQAASKLSKQFGILDFAPLRDAFIETCSQLYLPGSEELSALKVPVTSEVVSGTPSTDEAFKLFKANNLEAAITEFQKILYGCITRDADLEDIKQILHLCREYILACRIELTRRSLPESEVKRNLELACLFASCDLQPPHRLIGLQLAAQLNFKFKNFETSSKFAKLYIDVAPHSKAEQMKKLKAKADLGHDSIDLEVNDEFCAHSLTPIYPGEPFVTEALLKTKYKPEFKGQVSEITGVTTIGVPASGFR